MKIEFNGRINLLTYFFQVLVAGRQNVGKIFSKIFFASVLVFIIVYRIIHIDEINSYSYRVRRAHLNTMVIFVAIVYLLIIHPVIIFFRKVIFDSKNRQITNGRASKNGVLIEQPDQTITKTWEDIRLAKKINSSIIIIFKDSKTIGISRKLFKSDVEWEHFTNWVNYSSTQEKNDQ
ncbi:MAG: hypothetical protein GY755_05400 [Chloroflexi bacterium]|nr:hypothetical protein [Chloroflexota bacterium]